MSDPARGYPSLVPCLLYDDVPAAALGRRSWRPDLVNYWSCLALARRCSIGALAVASQPRLPA
jgi:hypothetical protein